MLYILSEQRTSVPSRFGLHDMHAICTLASLVLRRVRTEACAAVPTSPSFSEQRTRDQVGEEAGFLQPSL